MRTPEPEDFRKPSSDREQDEKYIGETEKNLVIDLNKEALIIKPWWKRLLRL